MTATVRLRHWLPGARSHERHSGTMVCSAHYSKASGTTWRAGDKASEKTMKPSSPRRTLETLLGPLRLNRKLPPEAGGATMSVSGRIGGLKFLFRRSEHWDPGLLSIARRLILPGDHVWDVGANVGLFALAAAYHAGARGSVLAVEADRDAVSMLARSRRHLSPRHAPLTILPAAFANHDGILQFGIARRARAANAIAGFGSSQTGGFRTIRTLPCLKPDTLLNHLDPPQVMKIDVEGAELSVLGGAQHLLTDHQPVLCCEVCDRTRADVIALLGRHDYLVFDGASFDGHRDSAPASATTCDVVAITRSKLNERLAKDV